MKQLISHSILLACKFPQRRFRGLRCPSTETCCSASPPLSRGQSFSKIGGEKGMRRLGIYFYFTRLPYYSAVAIFSVMPSPRVLTCHSRCQVSQNRLLSFPSDPFLSSLQTMWLFPKLLCPFMAILQGSSEGSVTVY